MISICLFLKVHQPFQLNQYRSKHIEVLHSYEDAEADLLMINKLADECYLPANKIILSNIIQTQGKFKVSFSISGTVLELLLKYRPDVIESFQEIIKTGAAEVLSEPYYHSLSYIYAKKEFKRQVQKHQSFIRNLFQIRPVIFRNPDLLYNNELPESLSGLGIQGILCEGRKQLLHGRSPNQVYDTPQDQGIKLLLRNSTLSDDIAFRFGQQQWNEYPLTAAKFAGWVQQHPAQTQVINLMLDYETFGIHKKKEEGIFDFLEALPGEILQTYSVVFSLPSEVIDASNPPGGVKEIYDVKETISWENNSGGSGNRNYNMMQNNTLKKLYSLENLVKNADSGEAWDTWGKLQSSDYFNYMADDEGQGQAYKYIDPFHSPKEIYEYFTNILIDFEICLIKKSLAKRKKSLLGGNWTLLSN